VPATGKELERRWRALRGDGAGRFALLRAVAAGGAGIRELCRAELDATLLSEAVLVLAEHAPAAAAGGGEGAGPAALEQAVALLEDMAQAGRFSLNVRFLGKAERESVPTAPVGPARSNRPAGALCDPPVVISPCVGHGRCGCCLKLRELSTLGCLSGPTLALSRTSCRSAVGRQGGGDVQGCGRTVRSKAREVVAIIHALRKATVHIRAESRTRLPLHFYSCQFCTPPLISIKRNCRHPRAPAALCTRRGRREAPQARLPRALLLTCVPLAAGSS